MHTCMQTIWAKGGVRSLPSKRWHRDVGRSDTRYCAEDVPHIVRAASRSCFPHKEVDVFVRGSRLVVFLESWPRRIDRSQRDTAKPRSGCPRRPRVRVRVNHAKLVQGRDGAQVTAFIAAILDNTSWITCIALSTMLAPLASFSFWLRGCLCHELRHSPCQISWSCLASSRAFPPARFDASLLWAYPLQRTHFTLRGDWPLEQKCFPAPPRRIDVLNPWTPLWSSPRVHCRKPIRGSLGSGMTLGNIFARVWLQSASAFRNDSTLCRTLSWLAELCPKPVERALASLLEKTSNLDASLPKGALVREG